MTLALKEMLDELGLHEKWITTNIVDRAFVEIRHSLLPDPNAEHLRIQFYAKFFKDRKSSKISDADIETYLELAALEMDVGLKSWAIGSLIECGNLSVPQLIILRHTEMLDPKHEVFLEREIKNARD